MIVRILREALTEAGAFMEAAGAAGAEATGLLVSDDDGIVRCTVFPDQEAGRFPTCWVRVTEQGKAELAAALGPDERYVSRIHSHPGEAFHSATDDRNPALRFEGALSIVVPYFGLAAREGLDPCAVFVRRQRRWVELPPGPLRDEVVHVLD